MPNEKDFASLFQTVDEHPEPINAEVKGNLPSWLRGTLLRNGPGKFECGDTSFKHLFDAQALLHRFHIEDGHVTYSNRFIRSESYADSLKRGDSIHMQFGTFIPPDPCQNIFSRLFSWFWKEEIGRDNTLVNVFPIKGKTYAATETNFIYEIDPQTLETLKRVDLLKEFPADVKINSATAHPHVTPDKSVINISATYGRTSTYNIIQIPPSSEKPDERPLEGGKVLCSIPATNGLGYMHSFCITENYFVITEQPLVLDLWRAITHRFSGSCPADFLCWDPDRLTKFHVVDRESGTRVGVFTADPFLVFHHINAFEKDGKIFLDGCCFHDDSIIRQVYLINLRSTNQEEQKKYDVAEVRRYELLLKELGNVEVEKPLPKGADGLDYTLLYTGLELPQFNYAEKNGKPYKIVYGLLPNPDDPFGQLGKLNVETKEILKWEEPGSQPSEPVFVKAPDGKNEDDGVVLSCVINVSDQTTSLLVLDAKDFKELGRAVAKVVSPMSFHGIFQHEQGL